MLNLQNGVIFNTFKVNEGDSMNYQFIETYYGVL